MCSVGLSMSELSEPSDGQYWCAFTLLPSTSLVIIMITCTCNMIMISTIAGHRNRKGHLQHDYHDHVHLEHDHHEQVHLQHDQFEHVHLQHEPHLHTIEKYHLLLDDHVPEVFERVRPKNVLVSIQIFRITFPSYYLGD